MAPILSEKKGPLNEAHAGRTRAACGLNPQPDAVQAYFRVHLRWEPLGANRRSVRGGL